MKDRAEQDGLIKATLPYAAAALMCFVSLFSFLRLWHADLHYPIDRFQGDYLADAVMVKNVIETGSYWSSARIGAPFGFNLYDFPSAENVHAVILWILSLFGRDFALVTNLFYLLTYILSTWTALFVFRQMSLPAFPSIGMSLLFAFLPYHYRRSEAHLFLSGYYLIPLAVLQLLWVISGDDVTRRVSATSNRFRLTGKGWASVAISVVMGMGGVYYAFFFGYLLSVAALSRLICTRKWTSVLSGTGAAAIVGLSLTVNLLPSVLYHIQHGANRLVAARSPAEADLFSIPLTHLLLPISGHRIPLLAYLKAAADFKYPAYLEAQASALGIIGAAGFLSLIAIALFPVLARRCPQLQALGTLNLAAILLGIRGGGGVLFAVIVSSKIRAYARISVFIAFFALLALLIIIDRIRVARLRSEVSVRVYNGLIGAVILVGLLDLTPVIPPAKTDIPSFDNDRRFFKAVEDSVPEGSLVFQLPYLPFPEAEPAAMLGSYDHFRGYLFSRTLRWSFGGTPGRDSDVWECNTAGLPVPALVAATREKGFKGIYVDRFGYSDRGVHICSRLTEFLKEQPMESDDRRMAFYKLP